MSAFLETPVNWLLPSPTGRHRFGGPARHRGVIPEYDTHPVHLFFDLDLSDQQLGLQHYFAGLKRLPLYNPIQYDCCDIVYRVISDDEIGILSMENTHNAPWMRDHPYENYPSSFPACNLEALLVPPEFVSMLYQFECEAEIDEAYWQSVGKENFFNTRVGGPFDMIQGVPDWDCTIAKCKYAGRQSEDGKIVFAVCWEQPVPGINVWSLDTDKDWGYLQFIFSLCTGCGAIHSCNRCD